MRNYCFDEDASDAAFLLIHDFESLVRDYPHCLLWPRHDHGVERND